MADIFISYARADREKIEKLAAALEAQGYSVWWDRHIEAGAEFSADIERELGQAKAVIVCWSEEGSKSRWVKDEANIAAEAGKLVSITLDDGLPPIGFRQYHAASLADWGDKKQSDAFNDLVASLKSRITTEPAGMPGGNEATAPPAHAAARQAGRLPIWIVGGAAALLMIFAGVFLLPKNKSDGGGSETAQTTRINDKSIAVLPFVALSDDESDTYFGKGLAEELLNQLTRFPELKVSARTSAFSFEGEDISLRAVGDQLGVAHVLEGSVRRSGEQLRVTAQLTRASDGFNLWSTTFERPATDIFAIEDEIVREIARTLEVRLGVGSGAGRSSGEGVNARAYEEYLRGLTLWGDRDRNPENRPGALKAFQNAAGFDPSFADAWAAIGVAGAYSHPFNFGITRDEHLRMTNDAFEKAIDLDADNAIAHAGLIIWQLSKPDIESAKEHMDRALKISPNRADTHYMAAHYWMLIGDVDRAIAAFERAIALDPMNMILRRIYANFLSAIGRFDEAFAFNDECLETRCLAEGFPADALFQAIYSDDKARINKWLPVYEGLENFVETLPEAVMPTPMFATPAAVSIALDRPGRDAHIAEARAYLQENTITEFIGQWAPVLAREVPADLILQSIETAADYWDFVGSTQDIAPLYGVNPWPDEILRHPRYHAVWARPGMAELAAARRANGWNDGLPIGDGAATSSKAASIAVLPFTDLSQAGDQQYFSDGIAEEILNVLARVDGLKVASRTSSFQYKDRNDISIPQIAGELGVAHVLEGSVRKAGDKVRITAQLIKANSDAHLWSQTFDRTLTVENIFEIQDEIATGIVAELGEQMALGRANTLRFAAAADTDNLRAYEAYLEGRKLLPNRSRETIQDIIEKFVRATELDPEFARAWEALSAAYMVAPSYNAKNPDNETYKALAHDAANTALALNRNLPLAYVAANAFMRRDGVPDYGAIMRGNNKSVDVDPNEALGWSWRGQTLTDLGFFTEAEADLRQAIALDPTDRVAREWLARNLLLQKRVEDAFTQFNVDGTANNQVGAMIALALYAEGKETEARRYFVALMPPGIDQDELLRSFLSPVDDPEQATSEFLDALGEAGAEIERNLPPIDFLYAVGDYEGLRAVETSSGQLVWWYWMKPTFRQSPERYRIMREQGLELYWRERGFPPQCRMIDPLPDGRDYMCD